MTHNRKNAADPGDDPARPITVALLTHRRNDGLERAVRSVVASAVPPPDAGWSLEEILVVDNNPDGAARPVVDRLRAELAGPPIRWVHEAEPGIVAARNRALDEAGGRVLVFLDDDEVALPGWPDGLLATMAATGAGMVGGPVVTRFAEPPPDWVLEGRFFDLAPQPDRSRPGWLSTCNIAIDLGVVRRLGLRFDPRFPHGEDAMFSRLAASRGVELRWSATAVVEELVDPSRTTLAWRRNRHRISTDAWVRTELDLDGSTRTQLAVLARAASRLIQGVATTAAGRVRRREATTNAGLALISQARGGFEGLRAHRAQRAA